MDLFVAFSRMCRTIRGKMGKVLHTIPADISPNLFIISINGSSKSAQSLIENTYDHRAEPVGPKVFFEFLPF